MPLDPPGDEVTLNVPNCASAYMFELNGLHYYETVDCASGTTGWGVHDEQIQGTLGCNGTSCPTNNIITPVLKRLLEVATQETGLGAMTVAMADNLPKLAHLLEKLSNDAYPGSNLAKRRNWKQEANGVLNRGQGPNRDIDDRRKAVAQWIVDNVDDLEDDSILGKLYWSLEMRELRRAIMKIDGKPLATEDRPVTAQPIGTGSLNEYVKNENASIVDDVDDAEIPTGGKTTPYVKVKRKGNHHESADRDAYFRLLIVELTDSTLLKIGQEVEEEDLASYLAGQGLNLNQVKSAKFVDRHEFFHVLRVTEGETDHDYFVYSVNSFRSKESVV